MPGTKEKAELPDDNKPVSDYATKPATDIANEDSDALTRKSIDNPDAIDDEPINDGGIFDSNRRKLTEIISNVNPYLLLFAVVLVLCIILVVTLNRFAGDEDAQRVNFEGTELDQEAIDGLLASETNIGTIDETLTVGANAIFNGKILAKGDLDVAGAINVGGPLSLPGITVAGESAFDDVQVNNSLTILGSASIAESLTVQEGLTVAGNLSVGGTFSASTISADNFEFTGDLSLSRHIDTSGGTPNAARGGALGGGGTVSISGTDIAGTITINTGSNPPSGSFATMTFAIPYTATPAVQLTPANSASASLDYFTSRTINTFSVSTASAPSAGTTYVFDYFISQ